MSAEYSVEEVREAAGRTIGLVSAMLTAYAERIKAGEGAVAMAWLAADDSGRVIDVKAKDAGSRANATRSATAVYSIPLFTRPPAHAAQVDVWQIVCDSIRTHQFIGPRDRLTIDVERLLHEINERRKSAEPAAQGEACGEKCHRIQENRDYWYGVAEQYRQELFDAKQALAAMTLLSSYLDDGGWHTEAENVRNGIDLESYENELSLIDWILRHAHRAQPRAVLDGLAVAAEYIQKKADAYAEENCGTEWDTGATTYHYGQAGEDYHHNLLEIAEEIAALSKLAAAPSPGESDTDTREAGRG